MPKEFAGKNRTDALEEKDYREWFKVVSRSRRDPVWFMENILGVTLFPKQEWIVREFYKYKYQNVKTRKRNLYIVGGMRGGKTALGGMLGTYEWFEVVTMENPSQYYKLLPGQLISLSAVATSEKQVQDGIYGNIVNFIENSEFINTWLNFDITKEEIFCKEKNTRIRALTSSAQSAVGRSNKCVLFDELANFDESDNNRGAWSIFSRLKKSTDTFHDDGHTFAISSPKHPQDIMMELYSRAQDEPQTLGLKIPTWEMNPHMSKQALMHEYRFKLPEFYRDYACEPQAAGGLQFPEGITMNPQIQNILDVLTPETPRDNILRVGAIDPAAKNDGFGFGTGYMSANGHIVIDGITKFQKQRNESYIKPSVVKEFIDLAIDKYNIHTILFDAWMFPELIEHLNERGIETPKHVVAKEDYDRWRELQESKQVSVLFDEELKWEAENLIIRMTSRKPNADHRYGYSKDMSDCVANIMYYFREGQPLPERRGIMGYAPLGI